MGKKTKPETASAPMLSPLCDTELSTLLKELESVGWSSSPSSSSLNELITQLVLSLYCNSHSKAGGKFHSQEIHSISVNFLNWMDQNQRWSTFESKYFVTTWDRFTIGLSRELSKYTFLSSTESHDYSTSKVKAPRALSPTDDWMTEISEEIAKEFLAAFDSILESDETLQCPEFLLHLEGWTPNEVAHILCQSVEEVSAKIETGTNRCQTPSTWRNLHDS